MINIEQIKKYFPPALQNNSIYYKYMLKEYLQLLILDFSLEYFLYQKNCIYWWYISAFSHGYRQIF